MKAAVLYEVDTPLKVEDVDLGQSQERRGQGQDCCQWGVS